MKRIILTILIVQFGLFFFPGRSRFAPPEPTLVDCRDGYAIKIPEDEIHAGRYLPCESFDPYYGLMREGEYEWAEKFLLNPRPIKYDKVSN